MTLMCTLILVAGQYPPHTVSDKSAISVLVGVLCKAESPD